MHTCVLGNMHTCEQTGTPLWHAAVKCKQWWQVHRTKQTHGARCRMLVSVLRAPTWLIGLLEEGVDVSDGEQDIACYEYAHA